MSDKKRSQKMAKIQSFCKKINKVMKIIIKWIGSQLTFQKILVVFLVYKGVRWVDQSYALAWAGYNEIASDLSQKALIELLGVALLYATKSLFENMSKNNTWPDKCSSKISDPDTDEENTCG